MWCVQLGNADLYNGYLQSLKRSIPSRGLAIFWDLLVQGGLQTWVGARSPPSPLDRIFGLKK